MSNASLPYCEKCQQPEYACECPNKECRECGCDLDADELALGPDICFDCYCYEQD
jgi:hypothetical protein